MSIVAGIDKMRKAELMELCEEKGIAPLRTVADMRYALKRRFEDDDDDDDDDDDSSSTAAPPPVKKSKLNNGTASPTTTAPPPTPGILSEIDGDATNPTGAGPRIIFHSVAKGLQWSPKGSMGRISTNFGPEPRNQHDSHQHTLRIGTVQFVGVQDSVVIASALCQVKPARGEVVPPFDSAACSRALRTVADRALSDKASVHIASLDPRIPGYDSEHFQKEVEEILIKAGVDVSLYKRGSGQRRSRHNDKPRDAEKRPEDLPALTPSQSDSLLVVPQQGTRKEMRRRYILNKVEGKTLDDFPLEDGEVTVEKIDKDTEEFWDLEERFAANLQGRNEDYVGKRIKKGQKPIRFILVGAERVENEVLECRFELMRQLLAKDRELKDVRERVSFHGTHPRNCKGILTTSLLRFKHKLNKCKKQVDDGYFGSNKKGVYVSRYADYTLKYANNIVALKPQDTVKTICFRTLPGKSKHIKELCGAIDPTDGFDSHSSPEFLEWFLFDESQLCPEYVFEVLAEEDTRTKSDDQ